MIAIGIISNVVIPEPLHGASRQEIAIGIFAVGRSVARGVCDRG
jgi:hypothetical protein